MPMTQAERDTEDAVYTSKADERALQAVLKARQEAYGTPEAQMEYITENGLEAWQAHVAAIKAANPKPEVE